MTGRFTTSAFRLVGLVLVVAWAAGCAQAPVAGAARRDAQKLARLDSSVATSQAADGKLIWYDGWKLRLEGKGWTFTEAPYDRLPSKAKGVVRDNVWGLSKRSAGLAVRFATDSRTLAVHWVLTGKDLDMFHMPATGMSGVDLYIRTDQGWQWLAVGKALKVANLLELDGLPAGMHEYMLYLPLYNGTMSLRIGVPPTAVMARPDNRPGKPVVFYGTSITQGGCASRPGMAYPAIIGRRLDRETINLGFSGNGRMEPELADLLSDIDASAYVIDCMPNMTPAHGLRAGCAFRSGSAQGPAADADRDRRVRHLSAQLIIPAPDTGFVARIACFASSMRN